MSRSTRSLLAISAMAVVAIGFVGLTYALTESERLDIQHDNRQTTDLWSAGAQLAADVNAQESAIDDYLLSAGPDPLIQYRTATTDEAAIVAQMRAGASELPSLQRALATLDTTTAAWRASFADPAIAAVQAGGGARLTQLTQGTVAGEDAVHAALGALSVELNLVERDLRAREDALDVTRTAGTVLGLGVLALASLVALWLVRRYGRALEREASRAGILNQFTEVSSFATDDAAVAASNLEALALLVHPDAAVTHVLNHSQDRAIPQAQSSGDAIAEVLSLQTLATCAGMVRRSMYVSSDLAAPLSVHCPIYPAEQGTLACVPLISGDAIGAVHLYWSRPDALPLELRRSVARIAEHAALAIGNRRLLAALQGQASTDPRTGLANSRAFDKALEDALAGRGADEPLAVLMLDLDHFKDFNDRHGHPSGDIALRTFAEALRSCMRDGDLAARYGGEEFVVLLPAVDADAALAIAERIRARTESTIISLGPGITDRITVSIGVAAAPSQALDRVSLLRIADEALYRAKDAGRNRVVHFGSSSATTAPEAPRGGRAPSESPENAPHAS